MNFHCIPRDKAAILTLLNASLFQTFDAVEMRMTSQYFFPFMQKSPQFVFDNQNKPYTITLIDREWHHHDL